MGSFCATVEKYEMEMDLGKSRAINRAVNDEIEKIKEYGVFSWCVGNVSLEDTEDEIPGGVVPLAEYDAKIGEDTEERKMITEIPDDKDSGGSESLVNSKEDGEKRGNDNLVESLKEKEDPEKEKIESMDDGV